VSAQNAPGATKFSSTSISEFAGRTPSLAESRYAVWQDEAVTVASSPGEDTRRGNLAELPASAVRTDIQGLRAIAVLLVVAFHFEPAFVPGGYIGVDVFFVISGYLITSHLMRRPPTGARSIADFWGRRLRRLLPASLIVILFTVIVGCFVLPVTQIASLARDALASTFYVENWNLAANSVNYLSAGVPPSPLQHYWSLGVEEQFYLVWPFLVGLLSWLAIRRRSASQHVTMIVGLGIFGLASLVVSILWTAVQPSAAYFVTPTRLWELAAGGVLAAVVALAGARGGRRDVPGPVRAVVAWLGVAVLVVATVVENASTPFPGFAALLPVSGALLFIAANSSGVRGAPTAVLGLRPVQFVGDASYGIYLWHFPLIVLATGALARDLNFVDKGVILVATLLLAWLSKRFVENPVRTNRRIRIPLSRTFVLAAIATLVVGVVSLAPVVQFGTVTARAAEEKAHSIRDNAGCFGAQALVAHGCSERGVGLLPSPALAPQDVASAYADGCFAEKPFATVVTCTYGNAATANHRVALVGNSHAVQWLPALQELAASRHLLITTFVASGCMPTGARVLFDTQQSSDGCHAWGQKVIRATSTGTFDLVVTSVASNSDLVGVPAKKKFAPQAAGYTAALGAWAAANIPVLVIRDTPVPGFDVPTCVAEHRTSLAECDGSRKDWLTPDPMITAAKTVGSADISTVDLSDHFCDATTCYGVAGGVVVYFDFLHVGATFIRSTAPYLAPALERELSR
jgi:peptidoglycan/LPS O-acetylase OafA/YrhL